MRKLAQKLTVMSVVVLLVISFSSLDIKSSYATSLYSFLFKWGSAGSGDGQFGAPNGTAIDSSNNVYVADQGTRIQKFDSSGNFITKWGSAGSANGQFSGPGGVAVDSSKNVYVGDGNNRIQKFDSSGNFITKFGSSGSGDGQLSFPYGVALSSSGNVYVVDHNNDRVEVFGIPVGGTEIPIDTTALLLYGIQSSAMWWAPAIVLAGAGIGFLKFKKRN